jgi:chemotaxis protein methyltransferase CheR
VGIPGSLFNVDVRLSKNRGQRFDDGTVGLAGSHLRFERALRDQQQRMIRFREMNLTAPWPAMPQIDLVFMRNVLIYFDGATKQEILGKTRRLLTPDSYLFLGSAETTMGLDHACERVTTEKSGCHRLRREPARVGATAGLARMKP